MPFLLFFAMMTWAIFEGSRPKVHPFWLGWATFFAGFNFAALVLV